MKYSAIRSMAITIAIGVSALGYGQTNDAHGSIPSGDKSKSDTSFDYKDDRSKHVHEQTIVIPVEKNKSGKAADKNNGQGDQNNGGSGASMGNNGNTNADTANASGATTMSGGGTESATTATTETPAIDKSLLYAAVGIFGIAAIIGMYLIAMVFQGKKNNYVITILHGLLAAVGISLLVYYCTQHTPGPLASIVIFMIAALGGITMFYQDMTGKPVPKWLAVGHGVIALVGFVLLIMFVFCAPTI